jgi:hypothetical protein
VLWAARRRPTAINLEIPARPADDARAAAGLRTSAAHARWEEIQLSDVNPVIEFTRELMATHLE